MNKTRLSIVLPTLNAEDDLKRFFWYFDKQDFNKSDVELLIMDGGSTDGTVIISKKHGAQVIHNPQKLTEPGVALGFRYAKAPLVMILAADNIFPDPNAISSMIRIFDNKKIAAAYPKHDTGPGDNLYSRYINTFTDPFTHFVYGDAANARTFKNIYSTLIHTENYDVYDFKSSNIRPILALAQGFTIRKSVMPNREEVSDDVLTVYKLIEKHKNIAYAHSIRLWHYTIRDTKQFIAKQRRAVENALVRRDSGITKRSNSMTPGQKLRMVLFIPFSLTILPMLLQSIGGFIKTGDVMWFTHWFFCLFSALCIIGTGTPLLFKRLQ